MWGKRLFDVICVSFGSYRQVDNNLLTRIVLDI